MKTKATTLSVIMSDSDTVHCGVSVGSEYTNLSLRFDRGDAAVLCGYPMHWGVHDTNVNYYDSESPTWAELVQGDGVEDDGQVYVSAETEAKILKGLKRSIQRQFRDPMWAEHCTDSKRAEVLLKLTNAIKTLESL